MYIYIYILCIYYVDAMSIHIPYYTVHMTCRNHIWIARKMLAGFEINKAWGPPNGSKWDKPPEENI